MEYTKIILALLLIPGISRKTVKLLVDKVGRNLGHSAEGIYSQIMDLKRENNRVKVPTVDLIRDKIENAEALLKNTEQKGIKVLTLLDEEYPQALRTVPDQPVLLYYKGDLSILNNDCCVAIIGTRQPTAKGSDVALMMGKQFGDKGCCIISGLAIGCDTLGHKGCLESKGKTVAVLASGIDEITPISNRGLADEILKAGGLIISEYPIGTKPMNGYYLERNRLQSGLSKAVVVIESDITGGTIHTVEFAKKQKRIIACYMHPEDMRNLKQAQGTMKLINGNEALPLKSPKDIDGLIQTLKATNYDAKQAGDLEEQLVLFI